MKLPMVVESLHFLHLAFLAVNLGQGAGDNTYIFTAAIEIFNCSSCGESYRLELRGFLFVLHFWLVD